LYNHRVGKWKRCSAYKNAPLLFRKMNNVKIIKKKRNEIFLAGLQEVKLEVECMFLDLDEFQISIYTTIKVING